MTKLTAEEKRNGNLIKDMIENSTNDYLDCSIIPYGCNVEIRCNDVLTLEYVKTIMDDLLREQQLDSIKGSIRVTYNHFIKK